MEEIFYGSSRLLSSWSPLFSDLSKKSPLHSGVLPQAIQLNSVSSIAKILAVAVAHKILKDHFKRRNILKLIDYFFMF